MGAKQLLLLAAGVVPMLFAGVASLVLAERILEVGVRLYDRHPTLRKLNPWYGMMKTGYGVFMLRVAGLIVSLGAALGALLVLGYPDR